MKANAQEEANAAEKKVAANWTAAEKGEFLKYFTVYGKNWKMLAQFIPTKGLDQVPRKARVLSITKPPKLNLSIQSSLFFRSKIIIRVTRPSLI